MPYPTHTPDEYIICADCLGDGWGPMLRKPIWNSIEPEHSTIRWCRGIALPYKFLCERCMTVRLGRPLQSSDLRDCPMNYRHPSYKPHRRTD